MLKKVPFVFLLFYLVEEFIFAFHLKTDFQIEIFLGKKKTDTALTSSCILLSDSLLIT